MAPTATAESEDDAAEADVDDANCTLSINTHFGELLRWAPSGLCCPARYSK